MLLELHSGLADTSVLFALALGIWGIFRYFRGQGVDGSYLGAVVIGELLLIVQALLGVFLFGGGARPANTSMHILYGLVAIITFPALYAFTGGRTSRQEMLFWALIAFFVFGAALRAQSVA